MLNKEKLSPRDLELLAAAVDGILGTPEQVEFNKRLGESQHFAESYHQQKELKQMMAELPSRPVPHNFTLTRAEAKKAKRSSIWQPMFGWASAISAILFAVIFGSELIFNNYSASPALMARDALSQNESSPMAGSTEADEDLPVNVLNWTYSGYGGIGGKGGAGGGISNSGGYDINIFVASVPEATVENRVEEFVLSSEAPSDQPSEMTSDETFEEAIPEARVLPEEELEEPMAIPDEAMAEPMAIPEEALAEPLAIPESSPMENIEPLEHEAPIIYGINPEKMGEVIKESVTVHEAEPEAEAAKPESQELVPLSWRLGLLISAVLFGIIWLYLKTKR